MLSLLTSIIGHGDGSTTLRQCAGTLNNRYESSGFLTAEFTQNACSAADGAIDPNLKGNKKCCILLGTDAFRQTFYDSCAAQKDVKFPHYPPVGQPCSLTP
ncbi:hypothetical protein PHMEG_00033500 [Phytophthora megakarya]|uniref:Uncharacterized protein n=1 Tax=Phytophthora megakarya TaxID=4795 RepID=A0A225USZ5_9STRA|nr:hypothetical protein PHMEG_00033500 [Phytophthora megakarya]